MRDGSFGFLLELYRDFLQLHGLQRTIAVDGGGFTGSFVDAVIKHGFDDSLDIWCYEPNPANYRFLELKYKDKEAYTQRPGIVLREKALGRANGTECFNLPMTTGEDGKTPGGWLAKGPCFSNKKSEITVDVTTLAEDLPSVPSLIKLDLQGGELNALRGAKSVSDTSMLWLEAFLFRKAATPLTTFLLDSGFTVYHGSYQIGYINEEDALKFVERLGGRVHLHNKKAKIIRCTISGDGELPMKLEGLDEKHEGVGYICTDLLCLNSQFPKELLDRCK